jgi:uncharacterized membrane protein
VNEYWRLNAAFARIAVAKRRGRGIEVTEAHLKTPGRQV